MSDDDLVTSADCDNSGDDCPLPDPGSAESASFANVEEMQAAGEEAGWSIDYRQIQPGELKASTVLGACGDISLMEEAGSARIEVTGQTPPGHLTVIAPRPGSQLWVNGNALGDEHLGLLGSASDTHALTSEKFRVLSMHIPVELLQTAGFDLDSCSSRGEMRHGKAIHVGARAARNLRRVMHDALYQGGVAERLGCRACLPLTRSLVPLVTGSDHRCAERSQSISLDPRIESWRTIQRARQFIELNLSNRIRMADVCAYAAVSLSKLERAFRTELEMTPSEYLRARRLAAARRELKRCAFSGKDVAGVAYDLGFNHLSRFAGAYRTQFGELPSATLRFATESASIPV